MNDFGAMDTLLLGPVCMNEASRIKGGGRWDEFTHEIIFIFFTVHFN